MKTDEADGKETLHPHVRQSGIVGMAHHKARQNEEEVNTQKTMVHLLERITRSKGNGLEQMIHEHGTGCHSTQPVEN